jgi:hypothetical protein
VELEYQARKMAEEEEAQRCVISLVLF